jgi:biopolymer transport protein ExbD
MTIVSPLPHRRGRLEIIPLIDIMFFLLAAFMLVSINKIHVKSLKVNLPTNVPTAQIEKKEDFVSVSVNADGQIQIDKELIADKNAVLPKLQALYAQNKDQKFLISADKEARNGDVVTVLGQLRAAGFQKVAFSISTVPVVPGASGSGAAPVTAALPQTPVVTAPASAQSAVAPVPSLAPPSDAPAAPAQPAQQ